MDHGREGELMIQLRKTNGEAQEATVGEESLMLHMDRGIDGRLMRGEPDAMMSVMRRCESMRRSVQIRLSPRKRKGNHE